MIHPSAKVNEGTNKKLPARNMPVRLLALYTDCESHNAQRYRQTDRQTFGPHDDANSQSSTMGQKEKEWEMNLDLVLQCSPWQCVQACCSCSNVRAPLDSHVQNVRPSYTWNSVLHTRKVQSVAQCTQQSKRFWPWRVITCNNYK